MDDPRGGMPLGRATARSRDCCDGCPGGDAAPRGPPGIVRSRLSPGTRPAGRV